MPRLALAMAPSLAGARDAAVRRIAVFRALMLGDMLCLGPALRALKAAHPQAQLTLIGLPWARELAARLRMVDEFIAFPGFPGLPETEPDLPALPRFLQHVQAQRFDCLLQMHGSGQITNPLLAACAARRLAGFYQPLQYCPEPPSFLAWPEQGSEVDRLLALVAHLGVPLQGRELEFTLQPRDHAELAQVWRGAGQAQPYVCVHPGARWPSRRWPASRFAEVADRLSELGYTVVLSGSVAELGIGQQVQQAMRRPAVNLIGQTTLGILGALIQGAQLLVCNDSGASHLACALGTRSVVISCGSEVERWAPLDRSLHQVIARQLPCRPCGYIDCPQPEHGCATQVSSAAVIEVAQRLLRPKWAGAESVGLP